MKNTKRSSSHSQHHIMAERKRREKLTQQFLALSAILPGLKKTDKASVLGDAIKYVKQLQERQRFLEGQIPNPEMRSIPGSPNPKDDNSSGGRNEMRQSTSSSTLPEIQVRVLATQVLIRIHCHKMKGILIKVFTELEKLQLSVVSANVLTFAETALDLSLTAEMEQGWNLTVDDIIRTLRTTMDLYLR
ncbi:transcription factor bHLH18-like [Cryptomeria japonica]|uniref:transcription factor bHLH18-like n=1 Tax=Cryptomeria japonica TaxID=3369 RepID=UPI0027DA8D9A|nr:transcription factor bHLH18-like [Cryptomeria japonica]